MKGAEAERRELGRELARVRRAAGLTQRQLGKAVGYSRSTVSNAELGHPDVARMFWVRCDQALDTGQLFTAAFRKIRGIEDGQATRRPGRGPDTSRSWQRVTGGQLEEALAGYQDLGWHVVSEGDALELVTGDELIALELPRAAGLLAAALWEFSGGRADALRGLPSLPDPSAALAVIAAAGRCYFLAAAEACPWFEAEPGPDGSSDVARAAIRWHGDGSRIPAPPSALPGGGQAEWARTPSRAVRLAPPAALLGLLGPAAATAGAGTGLTLPGGTRILAAPEANQQPPGHGGR